MTLPKKHPEWALKYKQPGSELRLIKGRYYLYAVTSKWNKEKKRAQKITGKLLGRITEDKGFIQTGSKLTVLEPRLKELSVKTSGIETLLSRYARRLILEKDQGYDLS